MGINEMCNAAVAIDKANTGYDQYQRWSFFNRSTNTIIKNAEGDCSSVCGAIVRLGGYPVNLNDPFYTGTFRERLLAAGFRAERFTSKSQMKRGRFLLSSGHVEFCYSDTQLFSANKDERGKASGGKAGDQTGKEVYFKPFFNPGWLWVLIPPAESSKRKSVATLAKEVRNGAWGNDPQRSQKLKAAGYDPKAVQAEVNRQIAANKPGKTVAQLASEVLQGTWGNDPARSQKLKAAGYDPKAVQREVNARLNNSKLDTIAKRVINGEFGNGANRIANLKKAGYDPVAVQKRVNQLI